MNISLSEFGCIANGRDFGEIGALMNPHEMTGVYSGALMYEYAWEPNDYGIVKINGDTVTELPDFAKFQKALATYPPPPGDGGYNPTAHAVNCPTSNGNWLVSNDTLPAIPDGAKAVSYPESPWT